MARPFFVHYAWFEKLFVIEVNCVSIRGTFTFAQDHLNKLIPLNKIKNGAENYNSNDRQLIVPRNQHQPRKNSEPIGKRPDFLPLFTRLTTNLYDIYEHVRCWWWWSMSHNTLSYAPQCICVFKPGDDRYNSWVWLFAIYSVCLLTYVFLAYLGGVAPKIEATDGCCRCCLRWCLKPFPPWFIPWAIVPLSLSHSHLPLLFE